MAPAVLEQAAVASAVGLGCFLLSRAVNQTWALTDLLKRITTLQVGTARQGAVNTGMDWCAVPGHSSEHIVHQSCRSKRIMAIS